jgi:hypothetical protein
MGKFLDEEPVSSGHFLDEAEPVSLFREDVKNREPIDVRASNSVYLQGKGIQTNSYTLDANRDAYLDIEGSTDERMYQEMAQVVMPSVESLNIKEMLDGWNSTEGAVDDTLRGAMTTGQKWDSFLNKKKRALAEFYVSGTEGGGQKVAMSWLDFWPSTYRGAKQLVGLEDFNVPVIDDIADFTGGLKKDATIRKQMFVDHLKQSGHLKDAATIKAADAVGETLVFLNEIKRIGMSYGGGAAKATTRWGKALGTLKHASKISLFKSLTSEDATLNDRLKIMGVSMMYMSTPAASGQIGSKAGTVTTDFMLNSLISTFKDDGYTEIARDPNMDGFDKIMAAVELFGSDLVFSVMTKAYKKNVGTDFKDDGIDVERMTQDLSGMNPRATEVRGELSPIQIARHQVEVTGRGGINIDKAEAETKATLDATKVALEKEIAEIKEAHKPDEKAEKPSEIKGEAQEKMELEVAQKEAVLDVIKATEGKPAEERMIAVQKRMEKLGETIDDTAPIKTQINRINEIRQPKVREALTQKEFYQTVAKASREAMRETVKNITTANKEVMGVVESMPKDIRAEVMNRAMKVSEAKTTEAREKALDRFVDYAKATAEKHFSKQAEKEYDKARKDASALVKSDRVSPQIKTQIDTLLSSITKKSIGDDLALELGKLDTYEGSQMAVIARELAQMPAIDKMNASEIRAQADMLNGLVHQMKQISKEIYELGKTKAQAEVDQQGYLLASNSWGVRAPREGVVGERLDKVSEKIHQLQFDAIMVPRGIAESLDFLDRGSFSKLQDKLEASNIDISKVERDVASIFIPHEKYMSSKGYAKNGDAKTYDAKNADGSERTVSLGIGHRLRIYLADKDINTSEVMKEVGWKTELKDDRWFLSDKETARIISDMSPQEKAVGDAYVKMGDMLGGYLDSKSMDINGFPLSQEGWTAPQFRIGSSFLNKQGDMDFGVDIDKGKGFNEQMVKFGVESSGRFKKRTGSDEALLMYNPVTVMKGVERVVAMYYGRADALRDANKFLYEARKGGDESLQAKYAKAGKEDTYNTFSNYIKELNGERGGRATNTAAKWMKDIANAGIEYTAGAIKYNPKVELVQLASLPTAATVLTKAEAGDMYKAFGSGKGASIEEMSRRSPYLWSRYNGKLGIMLGDLKLAKKKERGFGGIKKRDAKVIGSIWKAKENAVLARNPELTGEALDKAVEMEVLGVIMKTQPSFEDVSRPELARSDNPLARMVTIFSSQRNKNFYLGWKEYATVMKKQEAGTLTRKDVQSARRTVGNLALANGIFAAINTTAQNLMEEVMDMRGTKSLDDAGNWDDWVREYIANFVTAGVSSAGAIMSTVSSIAQGFDAERTPVSAMKTDVETIRSLDNDLEEIQEAMKNGNLKQVFDKNAQKYGKHLTTVGNVVVQPATGVNVKNIYKWFVESPLAIKRAIAPTGQQKKERHHKLRNIEKKRMEEARGK